MFSAMMLTVSSFGATYVATNASQFCFNRSSPNCMAKYRLGDKLEKETDLSLKAQWKYSRDGGAIGTIKLINPLTGTQAVLPQYAIVRNCVIDVVTTTSEGAGASFSVSTGQATGDLKASAQASSYTGQVACIPVGTAATAVKLTADSNMSIAVGTATLTGGEINVIVDYVMSEP